MTVADDKSRNHYVYSEVSREVTHKFSKENAFEQESTEPAPKVGVRHLQGFLFFLLGFIAFCFRVSLSVGIVAMTNPGTTSNPDIPTYPEWTDKNVILSAFFWGYMIPQVFAGWAANRFGAKWFLVGTFSIQSLLSVLVPYTAAHFGSKGLMISRALQGLCQGFIYPSLTHLLSQWAPTEERSRLGTVVFAAGPGGTVFGMFATGLLSASWYGWPMVFYLYGGFGFAWCIAMTLFGYNSPAEHPTINTAEKLYIETSLGHTDEKATPPTPWKAIFTSVPLWATFATQFGSNYCFWTLLTQIPTYMNYVMHFDIKDNSLLSSLPYLALWILSFVTGYVSDMLINNGVLKRTTSRKVFNSCGIFIPAIALIVLGYTRSDQATLAVTLLVIAVGSNSAIFSGWSVNHMDLSPNFAGTLMGLCNGFSQVTGALAPLVVQYLVTDETDQLQWRMVFLVTAGLNIVTGSIFAMFASGDVQPWNEGKKDEKC